MTPLLLELAEQRRRRAEVAGARGTCEAPKELQLTVHRGASDCGGAYLRTLAGEPRRLLKVEIARRRHCPVQQVECRVAVLGQVAVNISRRRSVLLQCLL